MHSHAERGNDRQTTVGAGLPAMAVYQSTDGLLTRRYRRQASSHILIFISPERVLLGAHTFQRAVHHDFGHFHQVGGGFG
jgi:hypothetical protein